MSLEDAIRPIEAAKGRLQITFFTGSAEPWQTGKGVGTDAPISRQKGQGPLYSPLFDAFKHYYLCQVSCEVFKSKGEGV